MKAKFKKNETVIIPAHVDTGESIVYYEKGKIISVEQITIGWIKKRQVFKYWVENSRKDIDWFYEKQLASLGGKYESTKK